MLSSDLVISNISVTSISAGDCFLVTAVRREILALVLVMEELMTLSSTCISVVFCRAIVPEPVVAANMYPENVQV